MKILSRVVLVASLIASAAGVSTAWALSPPLSAADSDPVKLGWMVGSPPPPERLIRWEDMSIYRFPQMRWWVIVMAIMILPLKPKSQPESTEREALREEPGATHLALSRRVVEGLQGPTR